MVLPFRPILILLGTVSLEAASIRLLEFDTTAFSDGFALGLSKNGVVAGDMTKGTLARPLAWSADGTRRDLGDLGGTPGTGIAYGVSDDGSRLVGFSNSLFGREAFVWSEATGMVGLGTLRRIPYQSEAYGISGDGQVVVGMSFNNGFEAFRWTAATGMTGLGYLPGGGFESRAYAASQDGSVVVGQSRSARGMEAFRWTSGGGMQGLGDLPGGQVMSEARAVTADGSVIVGVGQSTLGGEAFRWTASTGMTGLGALPSDDGSPASSGAYGVSADGSIVVGQSSHRGACLWRNGGSPEALADLLAAQGIDLTALKWFRLHQLSGVVVKADRLIVAGTGVYGAPFFEGGHWAPFVAEVDLASPTPRLDYRVSDGGNLLSFTVPAGYVLQSSPSLSPAAFRTVPGGGTVQIVPTGAQEFYRLQKQP